MCCPCGCGERVQLATSPSGTLCGSEPSSVEIIVVVKHYSKCYSRGSRRWLEATGSQKSELLRKRRQSTSPRRACFKSIPYATRLSQLSYTREMYSDLFAMRVPHVRTKTHSRDTGQRFIGIRSLTLHFDVRSNVSETPGLDAAPSNVVSIVGC